MGFLKWRKQPPEPIPEDRTPFSGLPWSGLTNAANTGLQGQGGVIEASRRVVKALEASDVSAQKLGKRLWWLNLWLLIFTAAICGLTLVLVLGELGVMKGPQGTATRGAWVIWGVERPHYASSDARAWWVLAAYTTKQECESRRGVLHRERTSGGISYECLPDTVDPRGSKGK